MNIVVLFTKSEEVVENYHQDWEGRDTNESAFKIVEVLKELGHNASYEYVNLDLFEKLRNKKDEIDLVFNLCDDGFFSDPELEPHVTAILDILGIPYTGGDFFNLAVTQRKSMVKEIMMYHGLPTPKFKLFDNKDQIYNLKFPLIVKPAYEDASIGIKDESVVYNDEELRKQVEHVIEEYDQSALVEEFIDGREFNVGILGDDEKEVLPVSEITFDGLPDGKPKIVNYDAKWNEDSIDFKETKRSCPAKIDDELKYKLIKLALEVGDLFECIDYFRVDFRVDKNNQPFILEINQNPDISDDAGLAAMALAKGYSYNELIAKVITSVIQRNKHLKEKQING